MDSICPIIYREFDTRQQEYLFSLGFLLKSLKFFIIKLIVVGDNAQINILLFQLSNVSSWKGIFRRISSVIFIIHEFFIRSRM